MKSYGIEAVDQDDFFQNNRDFAWITKFDSVLVDIIRPRFYLGYEHSLPMYETRYGFNGYEHTLVNFLPVSFDTPGDYDYTFNYCGIAYSQIISVIGVSDIIDFPEILYPYEQKNFYSKQMVTVLYSNGKTLAIDLDNVTISNLDPDKGGKQNISVTIGDYAETVSVEVPIVESIHYPNKSLHRGSNLEGELISIKYSNGIYKSVPLKKTEISGLDTNHPGKQTVTIKFAGKLITTDIEVVDVDSVYISAYGKWYYENRQYISELPLNRYISNFDVKYKDGTFTNVNASEAKFSGLDTSTPGSKDVTVEYAGKTIHTAVTVYKVPVRFDFSEINDTIRQFNYPSGSIGVAYDDGTVDYIKLSDTRHFFDSTKPGVHNISVNWHGCEDTLSITVVSNSMKPIKLDFSQVSAEIFEYEKLTGNVKAVYADGSYDRFDIRFADFSLDNSIPGKTKTKISFHGYTAPLTVVVKSDPFKPKLIVACIISKLSKPFGGGSDIISLLEMILATVFSQPKFSQISRPNSKMLLQQIVCPGLLYQPRLRALRGMWIAVLGGLPLSKSNLSMTFPKEGKSLLRIFILPQAKAKRSISLLLS